MYLKRDRKKILSIITAIIVIVELFINFKLCFIVNSDLHMNGSYSNFYNEACEKLNSYETDTGFYRIDGDYRYSHLDSWICNNHTITSALSTNTGGLYKFWKKNGGSVTYTTIMYDMNKLPLFDAILGVKYVKSFNKMEDTYYELYDRIPDINNSKQKSKKKKGYRYIYKNPYALSLGYTIPNNYQEIYKSYKVKDTVESMNRLMKTLSGNDEDVLIKYKKKYSGKGKYKININNDVDYIYLSFAYDTSVNWTVYDSIYINGEYVVTSQSEDIGSIKLKNKYANSIIKLRVGDKNYPSERDNLEIYYIDMDVFKKDVELMKRNQLTNIVIDGNKMTGDIKADEDSVLFTSIPYEKGWRVYVDGKRVKYEKVVDEFVGIRLTKGNHKIKMIYYPHHLDIGAIITIISIGILIIYEVSIRRKKATK